VSEQHERGPRPPSAPTGVRVDKWLWCARFFRTRSLAQAAVEGGHVQVNDDRVKSSRSVRIGDRLRVQRDQERMEIEVTGIPLRRGPAVEARKHYRETAESEAARLRDRELRRLTTTTAPARRPDKRERRELVRVLKNRQR
jgi:ribosome-associated heat shock protein Hsp15